MKEEIYEMFKRNFPYINREEKTALNIIDNKDNVIFEKRKNDKLIACAVVNKNTILLLVVDKEYRNKGIGSKLLKQCEEHIKSCGYDKITVGAGYDYLMPGVPTSKKFTDSVNENLSKEVDDKASNFFENQLYTHAWGDCNCFDMKMQLKDYVEMKKSIEGVSFRWATLKDMKDILLCADDACQYQSEKFSVYYKNPKLYEENNNQKVLVAIKNNKIVGSLIVSIETEGKNLGSVGCTCVSSSEMHQGIASKMVNMGTKYLKKIGLKDASLGYTYTGLDKMYGYSGYKISTYYFMAEKDL